MEEQKYMDYMIYAEETITGWVCLKAPAGLSEDALEQLLKKQHESRSVEMSEPQYGIRLLEVESAADE